MLNYPFEAIIPFLQIGDQIPDLIYNMSKIYIKKDLFPLFDYFYSIFAIIFVILYPIKEKISRKSKIINLLTLIVIFYGTYFVQYLSWAPVRATNLIEASVTPRYFLPLCVLLPLLSINRIELP